MSSLFGEEFEININKPKVKDLVKKVKVIKPSEEVDAEKVLKSKSVDIRDKLSLITTKVLATLGKQKDNIICIRDRETFTKYVDAAIASGAVAVDTETNNSTDPSTCKLMGLCLYYPGGKQAYIPINHTTLDKQLLPDQLTEIDCQKELKRIVDANIEIIMHNGKFDYEVIKCTCGIKVIPTWDTLIAARIMDENKFSDKATSLKSIYVNEIDRDQSKYSIEGLFENTPYAYVDPSIFAYYAATDSLMTYKVYQWERETFYDKPENAKILNLFKTIEMPIVEVTAEMELYGVYIDQDLGDRLKTKYNGQLEALDSKINTLLDDIKGIIMTWRTTDAAKEKTKQYVPEKTKLTKEKIESQYTEVDENGKRFKYGKSKSEQFPADINLGSSTQMAILLYDILGCGEENQTNRATGEDELKELVKKITTADPRDVTDNQRKAVELCNYILARRGLTKLITTYIDVIPDLAKHWPDGRIRYRLNSTGTDTGRFASGGKFKFLDEDDNPVEINSINSQNLPSHNPEIRLLFKAKTIAKLVEADDNEPLIINRAADVEMSTGWVRCKNIKVGDLMIVDGVATPVKSIDYDEASQNYLFGV